MSLPLYFVPGLGADERMFIPLRQAGLELNALPFIIPHPRESIPAYAARMAQAIPEGQPYILCGVSLGGMIASEVAEVRPPKALLLFSTIKHRKELPPYFRIARHLPIHRAFSADFIRKYAPRERRSTLPPLAAQLLEDMRRDADPRIIRWALDAVLHWQRTKPHPLAKHLHGGADPLFPNRFIRNQERVPGVGHNLVLTHPEEVIAWIRQHC